MAELSASIDPQTAWALLEQGPDATLVVNESGVIVFASTLAERMFGWTRAELEGAPLARLIPERFATHTAQLAVFFAAPSRRPMGSGRDLSARRRSGEEFPVDVSLGPLPIAGQLLVVAAVRDLSVSRRALDARHEAHLELVTTLASIADGVLSTDSTGRIVSMNPAAERYSGWLVGEAVGRALDDVFCLIDQRSRAPVGNPVDLVLRDGAVHSMPSHRILISRDGTERLIEDSCSPIRGEDGVLRGAVLVFRDQSAEGARQQVLLDARRLQEQLDCSPITVVRMDFDGCITHVNDAWRRFADANGADAATRRGVGLNYLEVLGATAEGQELAAALRELADGHRAHISQRYACHSPTELRWCEIEAWRLAPDDALVLMHSNVTQRQLKKASLHVQRVIAQVLAERLPLPAACGAVMRLAAESFVWDVAAVWVVTDDARLRCVDTWVRPGLIADAFVDASRAASFSRGEGLAGRAWASCACEWIGDLSTDTNFPRALPAAAAGLRCGLAAPLHCNGEVFGVIEFFGVVPRPPVPEFVELSQSIGIQLGRDVLRARAEHAAAQAEEALAAAHGRLQAIVDCAPDFVMSIDRSGTIEFINRVLPGYRKEDVIGSNWLLYSPADQHPAMSAALMRSLDEGEASTYEVRSTAPDGSSVWFESHIAPVRRGELIVGAVVVGREVTAQRRLEAQLLASERMASMGTLAAGVAHEINNPMAAVIANIGLALQEAEKWTSKFGLPADLTDELHDARDAAERVRLIVRDLRNLSRAEDEVRAPVDLRRVLESTLRLCGNEIRHRARLVTRLGDLPPVDASEARLGQVFLNLVMNAAQAIPEGNVEGNMLSVSTYLSDDGVCVEVADTGCGMTEEVQRHLFQPFFTTKPPGEGTGLGLVICSRIVMGFGGSIEVKSEPGKGSTFRVILPLARELDARAAPPAPGLPQVLRGRVLVIDDEALLTSVIGRILAPSHDVFASTRARDALNRVAAGERFDVIVCDLQIPEMTGAQFHQALAQAAPDLAKRVVFLTRGDVTLESKIFLDSISNPRLEKPFEPTQLLSLVNAML